MLKTSLSSVVLSPCRGLGLHACRRCSVRQQSGARVFALQAAPSAAVEEETQSFSSYPEPEIREASPATHFLTQVCDLQRASLGSSMPGMDLMIQDVQVDFDPRLVNSVGLLGRLGSPFQLKRISDRMVVATTALAVPRGSKKEGQEQQTDWHVHAPLSCLSTSEHEPVTSHCQCMRP